MRRAGVLVLAACGRLEFEPIDASTDASPDAASLCAPDYVYLAGNAALGTSPFCAMRFEAKARDIATRAIDPVGCDAACNPNSFVTTHEPASVPEGVPWNQIDAINAQLRCRALGAGYDLMSNREWMTIARDAERVAANWYGGVPGAGRMVEGMTDFIGYGAVTDPTDPYSDTGNSSAEPPGLGWEQRRTLELASGDVIWDFPGHFQEWVDWTLGDSLDGAPTPCADGELTAFACAGVADDDFNSSTGTYDSTNGVGFILGGIGNATRRGGQVNDIQLGIAGIYGLNMNRNVDNVFPGTSFRCVLRL